MNSVVDVRVKQVLWSKLVFKIVLFLSNYGLIPLETAVNIINRILDKSFRYKIGKKGKWLPVKTDKKLVIKD